MCRVLGQFAMVEAGDVKKMVATLKALPTINNIMVINNFICVVYNRYFCSEEEIQQMITRSGFAVQPVKNSWD